MTNVKMISSLKIPTAGKILLFVLKERGAGTEEGVTVTLERLGEYAGLHRNTTSRTLKELAEAGHIELRVGTGKGASNIKLLGDWLES